MAGCQNLQLPRLRCAQPLFNGLVQTRPHWWHGSWHLGHEEGQIATAGRPSGVQEALVMITSRPWPHREKQRQREQRISARCVCQDRHIPEAGRCSHCRCRCCGRPTLGRQRPRKVQQPRQPQGCGHPLPPLQVAAVWTKACYQRRSSQDSRVSFVSLGLWPLSSYYGSRSPGRVCNTQQHSSSCGGSRQQQRLGMIIRKQVRCHNVHRNVKHRQQQCNCIHLHVTESHLQQRCKSAGV